MARPRSDQEGPSAKERIEQAFWQLLEQKPYRQITVKELTQTAQVNHNTFYYHYDNVDDLASQVVPLVFSQPTINALTESILHGGIDTTLLRDDEHIRLRYRHIRLLLGSESPELLLPIKQNVFDCWLSILGLELEGLPAEDQAKLEFVWGGLTAAITSEQGASFEGYMALLEGSIGAAASAVIQDIVADNAGEGGAAGEGGD